MRCCVCGKVIDTSLYVRPMCSSECYMKRYWMDIIEEKEDHVIIEGRCCFIAPEHDTTRPRGHSGRKFILKSLFDGKIIETTNLWYQGEIPEEFREALPDTHIVIKDKPEISNCNI